jgi:hypothetical protein
MLEHITQQLYTHYRDEPVAAKMVARGLVGFGAQEVTRPQGLLASVAAGSLAWKAAAGLLASTALFFGLWRIEDAAHDRDEAKLRDARAELKGVRDNRNQWIEAYERERVAAQQASASASQSAKTIEAERASARTRAARERKRQDAIKAALDGGAPPEWGLRDAASQGSGDAAPATGANGDRSG